MRLGGSLPARYAYSLTMTGTGPPDSRPFASTTAPVAHSQQFKPAPGFRDSHGAGPDSDAMVVIYPPYSRPVHRLITQVIGFGKLLGRNPGPDPDTPTGHGWMLATPPSPEDVEARLERLRPQTPEQALDMLDTINDTLLHIGYHNRQRLEETTGQPLCQHVMEPLAQLVHSLVAGQERRTFAAYLHYLKKSDDPAPAPDTLGELYLLVLAVQLAVGEADEGDALYPLKTTPLLGKMLADVVACLQAAGAADTHFVVPLDMAQAA